MYKQGPSYSIRAYVYIHIRILRFSSAVWRTSSIKEKPKNAAPGGVQVGLV